MDFNDLSFLGGAFAPLIALSGSPFVALTIMSGVGMLLNLGWVDPSGIPVADTVAQLPVSNVGAFIALLTITGLKYFLSIFGASKIFCDATMGKIEDWSGALISTVGMFLITSTAIVGSAEATTSSAEYSASGAGPLTFVFAGVIGLVVSAAAYIIYTVTKTMVRGIDILVFLTAPIPGATAVITTLKYIAIGLFTIFALLFPLVASFFGVVALITAFLVFRTVKRIEVYYRTIYVSPLLRSVFGGYFISVVPKKTPRSAVNEFGNVTVCLEGFFMNKTTPFYKRERCLFIRANGVNYLFKKRLFGKKIKIALTDDTYIEKTTAIANKIALFTRIFTDEAMPLNRRKINLVLRREHNRLIDTLTTDANLINYNLITEERARQKAEERARKLQELKTNALQLFR